MAYCALSVGPLNKDMSTMIAHLHCSGHFHKLKSGSDPIANMPRVQLMAMGMRREKGDTARKFPFMVHDLKLLKSVLGLTTADHLTAWCVALLGWFFMLRMSEILVSGNKNQSDDRRPLHMKDIESLSLWESTHWGIMWAK